MNNEPVAWMVEDDEDISFIMNGKGLAKPDNSWKSVTPLYTHPVKELNDGGEPVKNATYWKRQYNLMASQNDNLKSGLYHANEQIKYLESYPVKEQEPTVPKNMQEWKGMDGATAYLLIDRHADNWADAKQMMEEWLEANSNLVNPYQSITDTKIEPTVVSYTHPVKELTETDLILILEVLIDSYDDTNRGFLEYEAMYKNSPMRKARIDGMKRMVDKHTHAIEMVEAILRKAQGT